MSLPSGSVSHSSTRHQVLPLAVYLLTPMVFLLGQTGVAGANSRKEDRGHEAALRRARSSSARLKRRRLPKRWTGIWPRRTAWYRAFRDGNPRCAAACSAVIQGSDCNLVATSVSISASFSALACLTLSWMGVEFHLLAAALAAVKGRG